MLRSNKFLLASGLLLVLVSSHVNASEPVVVHGKAYKPESDTLLYTEKHFREKDHRQTVLYYEPDGDEFARKTLDYSVRASAPMFQQVNQKPGEEIRLNYDQVQEQITVSYRKSREAEAETSKLPMQDKLVIDAGFDKFVKKHWLALAEGEELGFKYLLPTRGSTVKLQIQKYSCSQDRLCLEIYPKNPFLGLFASNIHLHYSTDKRQLMRFQGKSNIANENGDYLQVDIKYQHYPTATNANTQ